jgi:hypothetical protein
MHIPPRLDPASLVATRDTLHAYSQVLGDWTKACRARRKHWWQASLRFSLRGLTTGVIHADTDFEIEIDLTQSVLRARTAIGRDYALPLQGQPASEVARELHAFLQTILGPDALVSKESLSKHQNAGCADYQIACAHRMGQALQFIAGAMTSFRATIREETSPVQLWPHHFDLSMLWLPGTLVAGQDPNDEENADQQLNFGFAFGDATISEPYFYVTAYPVPPGLPDLQLPPQVKWHSDGFNGAAVAYDVIAQRKDPAGFLIDFWNLMLTAGKSHMKATATKSQD